MMSSHRLPRILFCREDGMSPALREAKCGSGRGTQIRARMPLSSARPNGAAARQPEMRQPITPVIAPTGSRQLRREHGNTTLDLKVIDSRESNGGLERSLLIIFEGQCPCRSEERRVGKECRSRWALAHEKKIKNISR